MISDLYEITLALQTKQNNSLQEENHSLQSKIKELTKELEKLKAVHNAVKE